ncbi:MAG: hypothetical protein CMP23_01030 [Rickettsiales bacterium]|nr:hypothetical protein [Rickettsiales bacterium]|tara:strand:+ start:1579 stop:2142 length:564 start_codon:yes stop_codon:yes gene_type:complete
MPRHKDFEEQFDAMREQQRHGTRDSKAPGEKLSWRELDRRKDRSAHGDQSKAQTKDKGPGNRYQKAQAEKALKGQLNALFADKAGDELVQAILDAADRMALQQALSGYREQRGSLPAQPALLEKALDCRNDRLLRDVVADIAQHLPDLDPAHRKVLLLKMKTKARTTFDRKVSAAIKALITEYGAPD